MTPDAVPWLLVGLLVANITVLIVLILRRTPTAAEVAKDASNAIGEAWTRLGLGESIGRVEQQADDMGRLTDLLAARVEREATELRRVAEAAHGDYRSLQQMLRSPVERSSFSELSLEILLSDALPANYFGIRERIVCGKVPDAHIRTPDGVLCVDSKFPLENFARWAEAPQSERGPHMKSFLKDAERHLRKIAEDYVRPDQGTTPFAVMYVASEAVYYTLATEGHDLLKRYVGLGVQVLSPLLLAHKLELLKLGIRALRLNEDARAVLSSLQALAVRFRTVDEAWQTFYAHHFRNLSAKAAEIDEAYRRLGLEFRRIEGECGGEDPKPTKKPVGANGAPQD